MADIINLRAARKAKVRSDAEKTAAANRAKFGRTRAQKQADMKAHEAHRRTLEGARLEQGDEEG